MPMRALHGPQPSYIECSYEDVPSPSVNRVPSSSISPGPSQTPGSPNMEDLTEIFRPDYTYGDDEDELDAMSLPDPQASPIWSYRDEFGAHEGVGDDTVGLYHENAYSQGAHDEQNEGSNYYWTMEEMEISEGRIYLDDSVDFDQHGVPGNVEQEHYDWGGRTVAPDFTFEGNQNPNSNDPIDYEDQQQVLQPQEEQDSDGSWANERRPVRSNPSYSLSDFISHHLIPLMPEHPLYPPAGTECAICYSSFHSGHVPVLIANINDCRGHIFGYQCLRQSISSGARNSNRCPLCRTKWFRMRRVELRQLRREWNNVDRAERKALNHEQDELEAQVNDRVDESSSTVVGTEIVGGVVILGICQGLAALGWRLLGW